MATAKTIRRKPPPPDPQDKYGEEALRQRVNDTPVTLENIKVLGTNYLESMYHLSKYQIWRKQATEERDERKIIQIKKAELETIGLVIDAQKRAKIARIGIRKLYDANPEEREKINQMCKDDFIWWFNCFVWGYDPRNLNIGVSTLIPHIMFPVQERLAKWIEKNFNDRAPMLIEKSRAQGVTEIVSSFNLHRFLFFPGFVGAFGSRTEDLVDHLGNPNAIFGKIRRILYKLPQDMRPPEMAAQKNPFDNRLQIVNPSNGSILIGEGGDNMGAGARSSLYTIDEKALVEHQDLVDAAVSYNTNCQIDISTPSPTGQDSFYRKRMSGKVHVFTAGWWLNPMCNPRHADSEKSGHRYEQESDWYKYENLTKNKFIVASQVDINYSAAVTDAIIPAEWVSAAIGFNLEPIGVKAVGFDIAAGGSNKTIAVHRQGPVVLPPKVYSSESTITNFWQAIDDAEEFQAWVFSYDMAGIGKSAHDMANASDRRFKFRVYGVLGGASAGDDIISSEGRTLKQKYRNLRAKLWWDVRDRFRKTFEHLNNIQHYRPEEMISIPDDPNLVSQLSAVRMMPVEGGRLQAESKQKMRARGVESPDYADALIYAFADDSPEDAGGAFNYKEESTHIKKMTMNWENEMGSTLISLYMVNPGEYVAIGGAWNPGRFLLKVYGEWAFSGQVPEKIMATIVGESGSGGHSIAEWIGSENMFDFGKDGQAATSPYFLFKKAGMPLKRNYSHHESGALILVSKMFEYNNISVSDECDNLVFQLSNWNMRSPAKDNKYFYAECLSQIITRLKATNSLPKTMMNKEYGETYLVVEGIRRKVL